MKTPSDNDDPNDEAFELELTLEYSKNFGAGESEAMAIAHNRNWVFASDDGAARKFAREQGIQLTGSIGILIKAVKNQFLSLSVADAIHAQMINEGYRSPLPNEKGISSFLNL